MRNIENNKLKICSLNPLTGFNRDGYCRPNKMDYGNHLVCAKVNKPFLDFTASKGNNLRTVVKEGDNWCLCQERWLEAYKNNKAPRVIKNATHIKTKKNIKQLIKNQTKKQKGGNKSKKNRLPRLRKISYKNKKHHYKLKDPFKKRKLAIHEGVNMEAKKTGKTRKKAAIAKKGRFNILRIYRKNKKVKECNTITSDMKYMDKKYGLGKTNNICGKKQKGGKKSRKTKKRKIKSKMKRQIKRQNKSKKQFLYNPNDPKKSFDVYIDKDPSDTIPIKYTTVKDVETTIKKLERLFKTKKYTHKRIWQVGMIMKVRLEAILKHKKTKYPNAKKVKQRFNLANRYFMFLGKRTKADSFLKRKNMTFKF